MAEDAGSYYSLVQIEAVSGGTVALPLLTKISGGPVFLESVGASSVLNVSDLVSFSGQSGRNSYSTLQATSGGAVDDGKLTTLAYVNLILNGTGVLSYSQITSYTFGTFDWDSGVITFNALADIDGSNFVVSSGATLNLPAVATYAGWAGQTSTLEAVGAGSLLSLSFLASVAEDTGSYYSLVQVEAVSGGDVALLDLKNISGGPVVLQSTGASSVLNVPSLANFSGQSGRNSYSMLQATNGGAVDDGKLTTLAYVNFVFNGTGTLSYSQFTSFTYGTFDWDSGVITFNALTDIDGSNFEVSGASTLNLPAVTTYAGWAGQTSTLEAIGAGSTLSLPILASVAEDTGSYYSLVQIEAFAGGAIALPTLSNISGGPVILESVSAGSVLNVPDLASFAGESGRNSYSTLQVTNHGGVNDGKLTTLAYVNLVLDGTGTFSYSQITSFTYGTFDWDDGVIAFSGLSDIDGSNFVVSRASTLNLPVLTNYAGWVGQTSTLEAVGAGSVLSLPILASVAEDAGAYYSLVQVEAVSGGNVALAALTNISGGPVILESVGAGSVLNVSDLASFSGESGRNSESTLEAINSGVIEDANALLVGVLANVQSSGTIQGNLQLADSTLQGNGTIAGNVLNGGTVAPGGASAVGVLTVTGAYSQYSAGALDLDINGATAGGQYDQLVVQGSAALGGTLNISLIAGFTPSLGSSFQVMNFGARTGDFQTYTGLSIADGNVFQTLFNPTNLTLTVATAAIRVSPNTGLLTSKNGDSASFTVALATQPTANVTVTVSSSNSAEGLVSSNLLVDGDGESTTGAANESTAVVAPPGWTTNGNLTLVPYSISSLDGQSGPANTGANFFAGGPNNAQSSATQTVNVASQAAAIDTGTLSYDLSGWLGGFSSQNDNATLTVTFENASGSVLGTANIGPVLAADRNDETELLYRNADGAVPVGTRQIVVLLTMTRTDGAYNDGYADDLSFVFGPANSTSLTFTPSDWNSPQAVTVTGVNDGQSGSVPYSVNFSPAVSSDSNYNGLTPAPIAATNLPSETRSLQVQNLAVYPTSNVNKGSTLTVTWNDANAGDLTPTQTWDDQIVITNTTTGATLTTTDVPYNPSLFGPPSPGGTAPQQFMFTLPTDADGTGNIQVTVTSDINHTAFASGTDVTNSQTVTRFSGAVAPGQVSIILDPASDSGVQGDNLTNDSTPTFDVTVNEAGTIVVDFKGDGTATSTQFVAGAGTNTFTAPFLADGTYRTTATFTPTGGTAVSANVTITIDTQGPAVILGPDGGAGSALAFNGAGDIVPVGNLGAMPNQGTMEFSMETNALVTWLDPLTTGPLNGNNGNDAIRFEEDSSGDFGAAIGDDSSNPSAGFTGFSYTTSLQTDTWYHVALTWDVATDTVIGYLNGGQVFDTTNTTWPSELSNLTFGTGWTLSRYWNGDLSDFSFWNVQETQQQIVADMNAPLTGQETGLEAYFPMNEGSGTIINDLSGHLPPAPLGGGNPADAPTWITSGALQATNTIPIPLTQLTVTFDKPINPATFTASEVAIRGPGIQGSMQPTSITGSGTTYIISFPLLSDPGVYSFEIGPDVQDLAGNDMDQNGNGVNGGAGNIANLTFDLVASPTIPAVTAFSPPAIADTSVSTLTVGFNEPINGATFTNSTIAVTGPNGLLDSSQFTIDEIDYADYTITIPTQTANGPYTVTIGPNVFDYSGHEMAAAYVANFTIDTNPPLVTAVTPSGTVNSLVTVLNVTFSKPIDLSTLGGALALTGPNGAAVTLGSPYLVSGTTYGVPVVAPNVNGVYTLAVGPGVTDQIGLAMGQIQDFSFTLALPALVVGNLTPQTAPGTFGGSFLLTYTVQNQGTAAVPVNWTDEVFLSTKPTLDGSAELLRNYNGTGGRPLLAPNQSQVVPLPLYIPYNGDQPTGDYYLIVETDSGGVITEAANAMTIASVSVLIEDTTAPTVANFSPTGLTNQNVSSFTVGFSKAIDASTFTSAQVTISGPNGPLDPSTFNITAVNASTFQIGFPTQSAAGTYSITLGTGITDLSGNHLASPYQTSFTIDTTGPHITAESPSGVVNSAVSSVKVRFDEPINAATFTPSTISLTDTLNNAITVSTPTLVSGNTYQFTFSPQDANGVYNLTIESGVQDMAGNALTAFATSFTIALPALVVDTLVPSAFSGVFGTPFSLSWIVHNEGTGAVPVNWTDTVYLSPTPTLGLDPVAVDTYNDGGNRPLLAPGASQPVSVTFNLPFDLTQTAGNYYLIVQTDSGSVLTEGAGASTVAAVGPINLAQPQLPDLAVSNVQGPSQVIEDPASITVSWTVTNNGQGAGFANQWNDEVILSPNPTPGSPQDIDLGPFAHTGALAPGASYNQTQTIILPPALVGRYYVFVQTDSTDQVLEYSNRADSIAEKPGVLDVMPIPYADLVVANVSVPVQGFDGQTMTVSWTVVNQGIGPTSVGEWDDVVYLATSPDGSNPIDGTEIDFDHIGFLAPESSGNGFSYVQTEQIAVPNGLSGSIYVVVTTNGGGSNPNVLKPVANGPFEFIYTTNDETVSAAAPVSQPPTPDLVVTSVVAPTVAEEGTPIDVTWTVTNQGQGAATGAWVDEVWLQDLGNNPINTLGPTIQLGEFTSNGPLAPGAKYTRTQQIFLPAHFEDLYTLYVTTDYADPNGNNPTVYEGAPGSPATQNDTKAAPQPIAISPQPRPDLQVSNIDIPNSVSAGGALSVTFTVVNQGTVATNVPNWTDAVYLSLDTTIDPGSVLIGDIGNQSALLPGQSYKSTAGPVVVPDRFGGTVYVIVDVDVNHQVDQWPNGNFDEVYKAIHINPLPLPDLVTSDVIVPTQVIAGATLPVTYTVTNLGVGATLVNSWTDTIWLSLDKGRPNPNNGDILLASIAHTGGLVVDAGYDQTVNVQIPQQIASGIYYITPWVDPYGVVLQTELAQNTNNDDSTQIQNDNYKAQSIQVLGALPDLTVTNVTGPAQVQAGTPVTITWTVENVGLADALQGGWGDRVYLSDIPDPNFDPFTPSPDTFYLGQVAEDDPLARFATYTASLTVTLSPSAQGLYWVVIANSAPPTPSGDTDPADQFTPLDEQTLANNTGSRATNVTPVPANLVVTNVSIPAVNFSGESMTFSYTVTNEGQYPVWTGTQSWTDFLWLTGDANFIRGRASYLGEVVTTGEGGLAPGASYTVTDTITLPVGTGETNGQYYLWIDLDAHDDLPTGLFPYQARQQILEWWPNAVLGGPNDDLGAEGVAQIFDQGPVNTGDNSSLLSYFSSWAYADPTDAQMSAPVAITFKEAELQISPVQVPANASSGETISVTYTVTNIGTRATRVSSWTDGIYLSTDPSLSQLDTQLATSGHDDTLQPGVSYTNTVQVTLPDDIGGDFYIIVYVDTLAFINYNLYSDIGFKQYGLMFGNSTLDLAPWDLVSDATRSLGVGRVPEYQGDGHNIGDAKLPVALVTPVDLVVTQVTAPQTATVGGQINVAWTVTNEGGATAPGQEMWTDEVYLAIDNNPDIALQADIYLGAVEYQNSLGGGLSYNASGTFDLPAGLVGPYYVFIITDAPLNNAPFGQPGAIFESSYDNNATPSPKQMVIAYPPPADLQVTSITVPPTGTVGTPTALTWTVTNAGPNPATGPWTDAVYFSPTTTWSINDPFVGTVEFSGTLAPGQSYTQTLTAKIPPLTPGEYYVIVRTDIFNQVFEGTFTPDKTSASNSVIDLSAVSLVLGVPYAATLNSNEEELYQVSVQPGQTMEVTAKPADSDATLQLFVSATGAPTTTVFDASSNGALGGVQTAVIPTTQPGVYYILIDGFSMPNADEGITLEAQLIPLSITNIDTDTGGTSGYVTTTITGADFSANAVVKLVRPGFAEIAPLETKFVNATEIIAEFNLGQYTVTLGGATGGDFSLSVDNETTGLLPFNASADVVQAAVQGLSAVGSGNAFVTSPAAGTYVVTFEASTTTQNDALTGAGAGLIGGSGLFSITAPPDGLYDVVVTNPDGQQAIAPYRFLVTQTVEPEVSIGVGGPRYIFAGDTGTYSVTLDNLGNVNAPYTYFTFGIPEIPALAPGINPAIGFPYLELESNVAGGPSQGTEQNLPWATLDSNNNIDGENLTSGYALNLSAGSFASFTFNVDTYPGMEAFNDRNWDSLVAEIYAADPQLAASNALAGGPQDLDNLMPGLTEEWETTGEIPPIYVWPEVPFQFNIVAAATSMTTPEFISMETSEADALRSAILADKNASPALYTLAANQTNWENMYLASLEEAGTLVPQGTTPPLSTTPQIISVVATLSEGVLIGPAGQQILSDGNLVDFFNNVRTWYGNNPNATAPTDNPPANFTSNSLSIAGILSNLNQITNLPTYDQFNLGLPLPTTFEAYNIYVPWVPYEARAGAPADYAIDGITPDTTQTAAAPLNLGQYYANSDSSAGEVSISGPFTADTGGFVPVDQPLPFTVNFQNDPSATSYTHQIRITVPLGPNVDADTFQLGDIQLGDISIHVPSGMSLYQGDFDFTQSSGFILRVSAGVDLASDTATWLIQAIDPTTGQLLTNPNEGLLPPNNAEGSGAGYVSYTVQASSTVPTGTTLTAQASITTDNAPPEIAQPQTWIIDSVAPTTTLTVTKVPNTGTYDIKWNAVDDPGGSGVASITLYVAIDGGNYNTWQLNLPDASGEMVYVGQLGHTYQFLALATDSAGNLEQPPANISVPSDGSGANLGVTPVVSTTPPNFGQPPPPTPPSPQTNPLFTQAQADIPSPVQVADPSEFTSVLSPFEAQAFVTGIGHSEDDSQIGPLAVVEEPDGSFLISGGPDRNELFHVGNTGGAVTTPLATLQYPIYDLAFDAKGDLWATTGGGPLLELDPATGNILTAYGSDVELGLAVDPANGLIYVGTSSGVQTFNPANGVFTQFSRDQNLRVASLAFAPDGSLWATTWPDQSQVVEFGARQRAQVMFTFNTPVDALAFGKAGTALANLLFIAQDSGAGSILTMVDLATLQQVALASGGTRGYDIITTGDGRVLISQSSQVDVLSPITRPVVVATNPPNQSIAALPLSLVTVTFDQDMIADSATDVNSATDPANYTLIGANGQAATIVGVNYDSATNTALLDVEGLTPQAYTLTILDNIEATDDDGLLGPFAVTWSAVDDISDYASIAIINTQLDRLTQTVSYEVTITNTADFDLLLPLLLTLDPANYVQGAPQGAAEETASGLWILNLDNNVPGLELAPGQSTTAYTVQIVTPGFETAGYVPGVIGVPADDQPPVFTSIAPTAGSVGQTYTYDATATDPADTVVAYLLQQAPAGMTVNASTGVITWNPTAQSPAEATVTLYAFDSRGAWTSQQWTVDVAGGDVPPVFGALPTDLEITEGQSAQVPVTASDANGYPLVYWADNLPPGATFTPDTHIFSWTPPLGSAGTYPGVTIYVSDGISTISETFTVSVAPAGHPPQLTLPPNETVLQGDGFVLFFDGSDPDGGPVTYSTTGLPEGAILDANTGRFQWTVPYNVSGPVAVPITVTSSTGLTITETITFTVLVAPAVPVFASQPGWSINEGQSLTFTTYATDPHDPTYQLPTRNPNGILSPANDPSPITYSISGLPQGASYDPITATFSWTPGYTQAGQYSITVTAKDGTDDAPTQSATIVIPITVAILDRAPQITPTGDVSVNGGQTLNLPVSVTDPNDQHLTLTAINALNNMPLPDFVTFTDNGDGTGQFHFTPSIFEPGNYSLTLEATDTGGSQGPAAALTSTYTFVVTVLSANAPPQLAAINGQFALVGGAFSLTALASDIYQDPLSFSLSGLPADATITPAVTYGNAVLNWTPTLAEAGSYMVTIGVTDTATNASASQIFQLVVGTTDSAPIVTPVTSPTIAEGAALSLTFHATDAGNHAVTWSATGLPNGAMLDPLTGALTWTPAFGQAGVYPVTVNASDGSEAGSTSFSITVTHTNLAPILVPLPPQSGRENTELTFTVAGADPDGETTTLSASNLPSGATFNVLTGAFQWTPSFMQAGDYTVTFTITNTAGLTDSIQVPIDIAMVYRPPLLDIADHQAILGQTLTFSAAGQDLDPGTTLTYSAQGLPQGATLNAGTGLVTWTPGPAQAGDYVVVFTASDGTVSKSQPVYILAAVTPTPPSVTIVLTPSFPVTQGTAVTVNAIASSIAPITGITLTVNGLPKMLGANGSTTIVAGAPGKETLVATATDADGYTASTTTYLEVLDPFDVTPPQVSLNPQLALNPLSSVTNIVGTVASSNLNTWTLAMAPLGSGSYTTIASGSVPIANGVLGQIAPGTLPNGFYELQLTATDISGRQSVTRLEIEVDTSVKPAAVQTTDTDLTVTLDGATVNITRAYDSVSPAAADTFGPGWTLVGRDVDLQTGLAPTGLESYGVYPAMQVGTRVYLTLPDGTRAGFTFEPVAVDLPDQPSELTYYYPAWQADPGVAYQLASVQTLLVKGGNDYYDQATGRPYNPADPFFGPTGYTLTAPDGSQELIGANGVAELITAAGQVLHVSDSGITAQDGGTIRFVEDSKGRIAAIQAPGGETIDYVYGVNGDLVEVVSNTRGVLFRYGYDLGSGALNVGVRAGGGSEAFLAGQPPQSVPLTADLGDALQFDSQLLTGTSGTLPAGGTQDYSFSLSDAEVESTNAGAVILRVVVTSSAFTPATPNVAGLQPVAQYVSGGQTIALFEISQGGTYLLGIRAATGGGQGTYKVSVDVAGDLNGDGLVNGVDSQLLAAAFGSSAGSPSYSFAADLDGNGVINAADRELLDFNYGFTAGGAVPPFPAYFAPPSGTVWTSGSGNGGPSGGNGGNGSSGTPGPSLSPAQTAPPPPSVPTPAPISLASPANPGFGITNGDFSVTDPSNSGFAWTTRGQVTAGNSEATLQDGGEVNTALTQAFFIPAGATTLTFLIDSATLGDAANLPPDAFEAALATHTPSSR